MFKKTMTNAFLILFCSTFLPCAAQDFSGTAFSSDKPFYGTPPYRFENSENYYISFRTDPAVIRALVPEPLIPISNGQLYILFSWHKIVSPVKIDYLEAYLTIPVSLGMTFCGYVPVMYLNKTAGVIPGRAIWGYNKMGADIEFTEKENTISITVTHLDTLIIKAFFTLGEPFTPQEQSEAPNIINMKYIPSVIEDAPPDVKQLAISPIVDSRTRLIRPGKASLEFYRSAYNPFHKIPILEIIEAGYTVNSFTMIHGQVLYDYLKK